jgi:hypothetical protein
MIKNKPVHQLRMTKKEFMPRESLLPELFQGLPLRV